MVQAWLVLLHVPPTIAQSLTDEQTLPRRLQVPRGLQVGSVGYCPVQADPLMLQAPGC